MTSPIRWTTTDLYHNEIYLTEERWQHIIEPINHPEMTDYESHLKETTHSGKRKQDPTNPHKYRYSKSFSDLVDDNTHIVAIVLFGFSEHKNGRPIANNFIVTVFQKEIG